MTEFWELLLNNAEGEGVWYQFYGPIKILIPIRATPDMDKAVDMLF